MFYPCTSNRQLKCCHFPFLGVALLSLSTKLLVQILEITVLPALFAHKPGSVYLMQTANQIRHLSSLFLIRYPESLCSLILRPYYNTIGSRTQNHKVAVCVCVCVEPFSYKMDIGGIPSPHGKRLDFFLSNCLAPAESWVTSNVL